MGLKLFRPGEQGAGFDIGAHALPPHTVETLALWFGFSPAEVALNRVGRLSDRQRQMVFFQGVRVVVSGVVLVVLNVILASTLAPTVHRTPQRIAFVALLALIVVVAAAVAGVSAGLLFPHVHRVVGPLHPAGTARSPRLRAGNRLLAISYRRWRHLAVFGDQPYRVYYAGRTLLSVEPWNED